MRDEVEMVTWFLCPSVMTGACSSLNTVVAWLHECRSCKDMWCHGWNVLHSCQCMHRLQWVVVKKY